MTNNGVGKVYEKVIQQVIDSSVTDVQDSGIDPAVLEELKKVWQEKLSGFKVASFPWDPPEPVAEPVPPKVEVAEPVDVASDGTRIKPDPEANLPPPPPPPPPGQPLSDPILAAARARDMVEKKFGSAAQQQQASAFPGLMLPTPPQQSHLNGRTDGPDDGPTREQADEHIRQIVLEGEQIRTYEDAIGEALRQFNIQTDVMSVRPLKRKKKTTAAAVEGAGALSSPYPDAGAAGPSSAAPKISQTDGPEMDEDAINSDLDDTDEEPVDDDEDAEGISQIMLCMYDKVQRTKNKWKCWLRNGVLTVNGKEYVFAKATGEYEW